MSTADLRPSAQSSWGSLTPASSSERYTYSSVYFTFLNYVPASTEVPASQNHSATLRTDTELLQKRHMP